jgi:hypothetical protein
MHALPKDILIHIIFPKLPLSTVFALQFVNKHIRSAVNQTRNALFSEKKRLPILCEPLAANLFDLFAFFTTSLRWELTIPEVRDLLQAGTINCMK